MSGILLEGRFCFRISTACISAERTKSPHSQEVACSYDAREPIKKEESSSNFFITVRHAILHERSSLLSRERVIKQEDFSQRENESGKIPADLVSPF